VLKEKDPGMIIEYGPPGSRAEGMTRRMLMTPRAKFPLESEPRQNWAPLAAWSFDDQTQAVMKDFSELAVGPDKRIYVLSQESGVIGRLEDGLSTDQQTVGMTEFYKIPSHIENAEGLIVDSEFMLWIANDSKKTKKPNIFRLSPISNQ
jgi:uncharacterized protein YjiK